MVASDLCATDSLGPADDRMQHSQEYHHEQQFQVSSPEEAISPNTTFETQEELRYLLEVNVHYNIILICIPNPLNITWFLGPIA